MFPDYCVTYVPGLYLACCLTNVAAVNHLWVLAALATLKDVLAAEVEG